MALAARPRLGEWRRDFEEAFAGQPRASARRSDRRASVSSAGKHCQLPRYRGACVKRLFKPKRRNPEPPSHGTPSSTGRIAKMHRHSFQRVSQPQAEIRSPSPGHLCLFCFRTSVRSLRVPPTRCRPWSGSRWTILWPITLCCLGPGGRVAMTSPPPISSRRSRTRSFRRRAPLRSPHSQARIRSDKRATSSFPGGECRPFGAGLLGPSRPEPGWLGA